MATPDQQPPALIDDPATARQVEEAWTRYREQAVLGLHHTQADVSLLAAALAAAVSPINGHLFECIGTIGADDCTEPRCLIVRVALRHARQRGYLA